MLGGARSLEAIAQFGRDRGSRFARALGFTRDEMPCKATFHNVFKMLDAEVFEQTLGRWLRGRWRAGWRRIAIDGKTLRGAQGDQLPGVHLLAAFDHEAKTAIGRCALTGRPTSTKRRWCCWM